MFEIKNTILAKENFENAATAIGLMAMTAAVTVSTFDFSHKPETKVVLPNQPALATVSDHEGGDHNPIRREREETAPHHTSYNESQRTPSRSGKV